jgi:HlyD family secretion protein
MEITTAMKRAVPNMTRTILVVVVAALAVAVSAYTISRVFLDQPVSATGYLQPAAATELNFSASSPITEILVSVGDEVKAGDVLARQDTVALDATLLAREAVLAADTAALQYQLDPSSITDPATLQLAISAAQAQLDSAQAEAVELIGGQDALIAKLTQDLRTAQVSVAASEQQAAANAAVCSQAQTAEDTSTMTSSDSLVPADGPVITFPPATVAPPSTGLISACNQLAQQVSESRASVARASAELDQAVAKRDLSAGSVSPSLEAARRQLELAASKETTGSLTVTPAALAAAQTAVARDTADVEDARAALAAAVLVAPTDGVVTSIGGTVGEMAGPEGLRTYGSPDPLPQKGGSGINLFPEAPKAQSQQSSQFSSLITLGSDQLEVVAQVGESDIGNISMGEEVSVSFPAASGSSGVGHVAAIEPQSVNVDGSVYFLVTIALPSVPEGTYLSVGSTTDDATTSSMPLVGLSANVRF